MDRPYIITQAGEPVNTEDTPPSEDEQFYEELTDVAKKIADAFEGLRGKKKRRFGLAFKAGVIIISCKALSVLGHVLVERERTKRAEEKSDKE